MNVCQYQNIENVFNGIVLIVFQKFLGPPWSPDLTPLDFFLWDSLKQKIYFQKAIQDVEHLERIITESVRRITPRMVRNVLREFCNRTFTCITKLRIEIVQ